MQAKYEALVKDQGADHKAITEKQSSLEKELDEKSKQLKLTQEAMATLESKMSKIATKQEKKQKSFAEAFNDTINSEEFKNGAREVLTKQRGSFEMEVKDVTLSSVSNPISTTEVQAELDYLPLGETPLFNLAVKRTIPDGKNKVGYIDADFVANGGYISEMVAMLDSDKSSLDAAEKTVEISKVGTWMRYSQEFLDDNSTVLTWAQSQALEGIMLILEGKLLNGVGNDTDKKTEIRGLDLYSTDFDPDVATMKTTSPTLVDLVAAAKLQIRKQSVGKFTPTHVFMSVDDVAEIVADKDANRNPLQYRNVVINSDGTIRIDGMTVIESLTLDKGTVYVITQRAFELHDKGGFVVEIERKPELDAYILYIRWRGQALITEKGTLGIVKFTSANLTDIATDNG